MRYLFAALVLAASACGQGTADTVPGSATALTGRVVDRANILSTAAEKTLTERLAALEQRTSDQVVVVTVASLDNRPIAAVSLELANGWGIGRKDLDNGVMLLVAPNDRKVRIEVGTGLEGLLTDARAAVVVQSMLPHFRIGDFEQCIGAAVAEVDRLLSSDRRRPMPKPTAMKEAA